MSLPKDIRTITDLRQRKAQLKKEINLSQRGVNDQINSVINPGAIRKVIITAAVTAVATFALRHYVLRRSRDEDHEPVQAAAAGTTSLLVQFMPLLQTILGFLLGFLRERLEQQEDQQQGEAAT